MNDGSVRAGLFEIWGLAGEAVLLARFWPVMATSGLRMAAGCHLDIETVMTPMHIELCIFRLRL